MDAAPMGGPAVASPAPAPATFAPLAGEQRIEALDVVRGFALLGIFLMNIEWFNRPLSTMGQGMPRGLTGVDWLASWFVTYFVQGKFWMIFSLLFGMGFAVMLVRAERAGRPFIRVYLRRILALAVFGAVHYIYLWEGDILFSYAVAALGLLIVLYGKARPIIIGCAVLIGLGLIADAEPFFAIVGGLAAMGLFALYLRGTKRLSWRGISMPLFSFLLLLAGTLVSISAVVLWLLPDGPLQPRWPMTVFGPMLFLTGWLSWKYHEPADQRTVRMAVAIYLFVGLAVTSAGVIQQFAPDPAAVTAAAPAPASKADAGTAASSAKAAAVKPKKTREERAAEIRAERAKRLQEDATQTADEIRALTKGSYLETVEFRARQFVEKAAGDAGFAVVLGSVFLLGAWFVRSGVMEAPAAHLAFFRKLALIGLPLGIGLGLLTSLIAMSHTPGDRQDGWGIVRGLTMLGNLPASLGYVGLVVTLLHSSGPASRLRMLAPLGRMALTNYLLQSLICAIYFFGFGLGQWGMPRAQQLVFVVVVFAAQVAFSHWWLQRFRYGPMEWLWRGFTYRQVPPLRVARAEAPVQAPSG
ncbi:MAG TPA: DUF418 domain-containing protein [Rubrivivax sp.]|nr:DUF418 domain-containing protein [Rubrivivax sp.]